MELKLCNDGTIYIKIQVQHDFSFFSIVFFNVFGSTK
jgi:hypothetical protein